MCVRMCMCVCVTHICHREWEGACVLSQKPQEDVQCPSYFLEKGPLINPGCGARLVASKSQWLLSLLCTVLGL